MVITLTLVEGTQRKDYQQAAVVLGARGEEKKKKRDNGFLGMKGGFDLEIGQRIELGFGIFFCINQDHVFTLSIYGAPVAPTSLCNSWPLIFPCNVSSIVRCTEVSLNSLFLLSFDYLHSPDFFKPLLRYDK